MWKYTDKLNGEVVVGDRQKIAEYLNIIHYGDIYDDSYWMDIVKTHHIEEIE